MKCAAVKDTRYFSKRAECCVAAIATARLLRRCFLLTGLKMTDVEYFAKSSEWMQGTACRVII